jgi:outer membrane lipoprotein-sorting protein
MTMSVLSSRPALRWLVPAAAAVAVIGGGAAVGRFAAVAEPSLPERSAAQLLVDLQTARLDGLSGTVVQTADLGLPELPALAGAATNGLTSLVSGSNTLRVWYNGPDQARVALLSSLGETDLIRNGQDVWLWYSQQNRAEHYRLGADDHGREAGRGKGHLPPGIDPSQVPATPQQAAEQALKAIDPTTEVTTGRNAKVAGRNAYELILAPRDKASLVGQVRLAIDATEHLPLRVEVFPKGADEPAFKVAFSQISFERPDASRFRFNPPKDAVIEEKTEEDAQRAADKAAERAAEKAEKAAGAMEKKAEKVAEREAGGSSAVIGEGWTTVFVTRLGDGPVDVGAAGKDSGAAQADQGLALLDQLPKVSGPWGSGRLLTSKLFSALLTDDGRLLVGAVSPATLYQAAGSAAAQVR